MIAGSRRTIATRASAMPSIGLASQFAMTKNGVHSARAMDQPALAADPRFRTARRASKTKMNWT